MDGHPGLLLGGVWTEPRLQAGSPHHHRVLLQRQTGAMVGEPARAPRMRSGRVVAGVVYSVAMFVGAAGVFMGALLAGCWHDCDQGDLAVQLLAALGGAFALLIAWGIGLRALRSRTWWPFVFTCTAVLFAARVAEFLLTR